ncbi:MAG: hypothetical protein GYA73_03565, partial [Planctomycetes bacterium]|nr:hypothetical protein [Planctomycetota bacterium]
MGGIRDEAEEVYDPFFFLTRVQAMREIAEDQIGIVRATLGADWICAGPRDAQTMGFETKGLYLGDWASQCEEALRHGGMRKLYSGGPSRDWGTPDPADTVVWLGAHMAEIRTYDPAMISNLRRHEETEEILNEARDAWYLKGIEVDDPIAWPFFRPRTPWLAR